MLQLVSVNTQLAIVKAQRQGALGIDIGLLRLPP